MILGTAFGVFKQMQLNQVQRFIAHHSEPNYLTACICNHLRSVRSTPSGSEAEHSFTLKSHQNRFLICRQ